MRSCTWVPLAKDKQTQRILFCITYARLNLTKFYNIISLFTLNVKKYKNRCWEPEKKYYLNKILMIGYCLQKLVFL